MTEMGSGRDELDHVQKMRDVAERDEAIADQVEDVADQPSGPDPRAGDVEQPQLPDVTEAAGSIDDTTGASQPGEASTTVKDPSDWVTGDEPMRGLQRSCPETPSRQAGEQLPADLTKAQASEHIDRLQAVTGRGR